MKKQKIEDASIEILKKRLLFSNIIAILIGAAAITTTVLYFLLKEKDADLLIVGAGLGVALTSFQARTANKIKSEIKKREDN